MRQTGTCPRPFARRSGFSRRTAIVAMLLSLALGAIAYTVRGSLSESSEEDGPLMHVVERGDFVHDLTERGNVESASNIEVRCEVQAQNSSGTRILKIIPEGSYVQKGDVLIELDSSALENDRLKQEIQCSTSEAAEVQAKNDWETAIKAREEYEKGKYTLDLQTCESEIALAKENSRRAEDYLEYSKKLAKKGYITQVQLQADQFAAVRADADLKAAQTKLDVLQKYTKTKMIMQLDADIATAKAKYDAQLATHKLDMTRLDLIKQQIAKCVVKAPEAGQVVYATNAESRGMGNEVIIEEGAMVRERQVLIRLPDPKRMQVKAKVNESKIAVVREGQPAKIRLDAFADAELTGVVEKVNEYPAPSSWWAANIKEYETVVKILDSPVQLKPGMTAEVKVRVAQQSNVVQVPVQSVLEHLGRHYCMLRNGPQWEARDVKLGSTNDKFAVIQEGLEAGESVALAAANLREKVILPSLPAEDPGTAFPSGSMIAAVVAKPNEMVGADAAQQSKPSDLVAKLKQDFEQADKNRDGKLDKNEVPQQFASLFSSADRNGDGALDLTEWTAAMRKVRDGKRGQAGGSEIGHGGGS